jgi:hypothetical protein
LVSEEARRGGKIKNTLKHRHLVHEELTAAASRIFSTGAYEGTGQIHAEIYPKKKMPTALVTDGPMIFRVRRSVAE